VPSHRGIQLRDQLVILDQLAAMHHCGHQPKIYRPPGEDLGDPRQALTQRNRIPQPPAGPASVDAQRRGDLGDHILVAVDGPVEPLGVVGGRAPRIQLTDRRQLTRAHRVCARAAHVMAPTTPASFALSNMCSSIAGVSDERPAMNTIDADSGGPCLEGVGD
jgi:hypothetical protein